MNTDDPPASGTLGGQAPDRTGLAGAAQVVLREQRLRVDLERVPTERVVLRRRIVTAVRQVEVTLRREQLEISRVQLNDQQPGTATAAPAQPLVIVLSEEVPSVQVATRPYEQVTVRIDSTTEHRQVTETLGREHAEVSTDDLSTGAPSTTTTIT